MDTTPDKIFDGQQEGELFGRCLYHQNKIADVDDDGYGDILISSRNWNGSQGRAYLYYGGPGKTMDTTPDVIFTGESLGDDFGVCASLFDIDSDGYADVLIGARKWPAGAMQGRIYLYWGSSRATFDNVPDLTFDGEADTTATFGGDSLAVGYVNDDGYADIVVPAYDYYRLSQHGRTYLFYGGTKSTMDSLFEIAFTGAEPGNLIMNPVIADFNGDKCGDIAFGGWGYPNLTNQGRVWLHFGRFPSSTDVTFHWDTANTEIGDHILNLRVHPVTSTESAAGDSRTIMISVKPTASRGTGAPRQEELQKGHTESTVAQNTDARITDKPTTSFTVAAVDGDIEQIRLHLARGTDINESTVLGDTALHYAIKYQHRDVAKLLIAAGADINSQNRDGETPAHLAIKAAQKEVLDLLLAKGADISSIHLAAYKKDLTAIRKSVNEETVNVTDEGGLTLLHTAACGGRKSVVDYLTSHGAQVNVYDKKKQTSLFSAASLGHKDIVELLIAKEADLNPQREPDCWTPVYAAVDAGHKDVVELLADAGGNVNVRAITGDTPLHIAILKGDKEMAELLIRKGADLNATNARFGNTPLHLAVIAGYKDIVKFLASKEAYLNVRNKDGFAPLHYAVSTRNFSWWESLIGDSSTPSDLSITELLITYGDNVNIKSDNGATPLSLARKRGNAEIVELLKKYGAKE